MLLDELQEHVSERYFSHYVNPGLLSAIYSATGRKAAQSDTMTYDNDDDNAKKTGNSDHPSDRLRQQLGKNHTYAEEIDDNLDYGSVDD